MQYTLEISSNCDFQVSQGSVETYLRWGGESLWRVYKISPRIRQWKNVVNQSTFADVMTKSQVYCLFWDTAYMLTLHISVGVHCCCSSFSLSVLTLLVGCEEGYPARNNLLQLATRSCSFEHAAQPGLTTERKAGRLKNCWLCVWIKIQSAVVLTTASWSMESTSTRWESLPSSSRSVGCLSVWRRLRWVKRWVSLRDHPTASLLSAGSSSVRDVNTHTHTLRHTAVFQVNIY